MADDLIVSDGTILVSTDEVFALAETLSHCAAELEVVLRIVRELRSQAGFSATDWRVREVEGHLMVAERVCEMVYRGAGELAVDLITAARNYAEAESRAHAVLTGSGAIIGWLVGRLAPLIAVASVSFFLPAVVGFFAWCTVWGVSRDDVERTIEGWLFEHRGALNSPPVVAAIRVAVSSVDDFQAGLFNVPFFANIAFGDEGLGLTGLHSAALTTTGIAGLLGFASAAKPLTETPVSVSRRSYSTVAPPANAADLARRVPDHSGKGAQIRVERYGSDEDPNWVVYVGGTRDSALIPGDEPFDHTSNLTAMAEQSSGSMRAVRDALAAAGVKPGERLVAVGYSQGAIVAAKLAEESTYSLRALVSLGGPIAQVRVPADVSVLDIVHTDDVVPALGGFRSAEHAYGEGQLTVRRQILAGRDVDDDVLPAHALGGYQETASLVSASPDPRLAAFQNLIRRHVGVEEGSASEWRSDRVPAPASLLAPAGEGSKNKTE